MEAEIVEVGGKSFNVRNVDVPEGLDADGLRACEVIRSVLLEEKMTYTGGCTTFYSPAKWRERGEKYGLSSKLIVCYDGGEVRPFFEPENRFDVRLAEKMRARLEEAGFYAESCTCWHSAVYPRR